MIVAIQKFLNQLNKTILTLIRIVLLSKIPQKLPSDKKFGECVLLGNGPSLTQSLKDHPEFINNRMLFCVNFFAVSQLYEQLKPSFYIIAAPEIGMKGVRTSIIEKYADLFLTISQKTEWPVWLYLPFSVRKSDFFKNTIIKQLSRNPNIKVCFFNNTPVEGYWCFCSFLFRLNLGMPRPHNVLIPSIFLAINLSFSKIYLLGADHSWLKEIYVDENNDVMIRQKHFYDHDNPEPKPMRKKGQDNRKLHEVLIKFVYAFEGYFILEKYARSRNVKIINATPGSYIDAFERYREGYLL